MPPTSGPTTPPPTLHPAAAQMCRVGLLLSGLLYCQREQHRPFQNSVWPGYHGDAHYPCLTGDESGAKNRLPEWMDGQKVIWMDRWRGGRWPWIQGQDSLFLLGKTVQGESQLESHPHRAGRPWQVEPLMDRAYSLQCVVGPHQAKCGQKPWETLHGTPSLPEPGRVTRKLGGHGPPRVWPS